MDLSAHQGEIPIPISSTYVGGHGHGHVSHGHHHNSFIHHHDSSSNGPPPPPPPIAPPPSLPTVPTKLVKYRECLKNHAASIGGNATDGCGEFMPSGEDGSLEALKCSACGCHRNFHRKEIDGEPHSNSCDYFRGSRKLIGAHKGVLISDVHQYGYHSTRPTPHNMIMPIGASTAAVTSESDEMEGVGAGYPRPPAMKKRFRTKFSVEQKEKMLAFADKAGWKLQKQEESVVQQFCQEIGVKRRVLKVWMHNNKHNLAKKPPLPSTLSDHRMINE